MTDLGERAGAGTLNSVFESALDGMAVVDEGSVRRVNSAFADLYGYDAADDLEGESWRSLYDTEEIARFETEILPRLRDEGEWRGEAIGRRRGGEPFPQELSLSRTANGRIVWVVRDVADRRECTETLKQYESILRHIRDGVYTLDTDGQITWVNQTAVEEFDIGYTRDELVGSSVAKVLNARDIETCLSIIQELLETDGRRSGRCEVALQTAHGGEIPTELHLTLLRGDDGTFQGTLGVVRDITERKRREQRLSVLNRVLRHNLRNDLNVIMGQADWLARNCDDAATEKAETIQETATRLTALGEKARTIESTLQQDVSHRVSVDIVSVIERRCAAFRAEYPAASITVDAPDSQPVIAGETVDSVVDNLVENAIEHAETAPEVTVSVTAGDGWVTVRVADNGPGIPETEREVLDSDEETQLLHGTGMGLWVVSWLVDSYGGELSFETSPDGSTVAVRLRAATADRR